jgi:phage tail P2-like protein
MSAQETLLPSNATAIERRLDQTAARFAPQALVPHLWNADTCPEVFLPYLAWALSVDEWDPTWGEERKRDAIREADYIHRHKGTLGAVRRALAVLGQPDAVVVERSDYLLHDGTGTRNGMYRRGGATRWATYRVLLQRPITVDQAARIGAVLDTVKRNCVHLVALDFTQAALRHNGFAVRNGSYTRGVIA